MEKESFKHRAAKAVLYDWLRAGELPPWSWRAPGRVEMELPFYVSSSPYYFEHGDNRGRILFVPDIVVFHQGAAHLLLEVVHKSAVSERKLDDIRCFFLDQQVEVWEIQAETILLQIERPQWLSANLVWRN